jgi:hypothetical protein
MPRLPIPARVLTSLACLGFALTACMVRIDDPYKKYSADGDVTGGQGSCTTPSQPAATQTGPKGFRVIGRTSTVKDDPAGTTRIVWSGTTVAARVTGASQVFAKIAVTPEHVSNDMQNDALIDPPSIYYSVSVDGGPPTLVTVDGTKSGEQIIPIAPDLGGGDHEITFVRESDGTAGAHFFYGLFTDAAGKIAPNYLPATVRARKIVIYGDSIAVGSGVLGANAACTHSYDTERATSTFGTLAGAELDAEVSTIAIRPVGVVASSDPNTPWIMPNLYNCSDPRVTKEVSMLNGAALTCDTPVDLTKESTTPVVVIALGTSDLVRAGAPVGDFQTAYEAFLHTMRKTYPTADIFCTLSPVLTDLNTQSQRTNAKNAIHTAVSDLADAKIYSLDFPDQGTENGLGCEENPSVKTHQIMADILATAIREKNCW